MSVNADEYDNDNECQLWLGGSDCREHKRGKHNISVVLCRVIVLCHCCIVHVASNELSLGVWLVSMPMGMQCNLR